MNAATKQTDLNKLFRQLEWLEQHIKTDHKLTYFERVELLRQVNEILIYVGHEV